MLVHPNGPITPEPKSKKDFASALRLVMSRAVLTFRRVSLDAPQKT